VGVVAGVVLVGPDWVLGTATAPCPGLVEGDVEDPPDAMAMGKEASIASWKSASAVVAAGEVTRGGVTEDMTMVGGGSACVPVDSVAQPGHTQTEASSKRFLDFAKSR